MGNKQNGSYSLSGHWNAFLTFMILLLAGKMLLELGTLLLFSTMWLQHMYTLFTYPL